MTSMEVRVSLMLGMMLLFALTPLELGMTLVAECCRALWWGRNSLELGMISLVLRKLQQAQCLRTGGMTQPAG